MVGHQELERRVETALAAALPEVDLLELTVLASQGGMLRVVVDGRGVDTGVLAPLKTAKKTMLKAVLRPSGIAFGILVVLASIKLLVFAMVRAARERMDEDDFRLLEVQRDRQHADSLTWDDGVGEASDTASDVAEPASH